MLPISGPRMPHKKVVIPLPESKTPLARAVRNNRWPVN